MLGNVIVPSVFVQVMFVAVPVQLPGVPNNVGDPAISRTQAVRKILTFFNLILRIR